MENQNEASKIDRKLNPTTKSKGDLYEQCVVAYCRRKRFKIIKRNLRLEGGEIDCLAWDSQRKILIIIEVRGRSHNKYKPSKYISKSKIERLKKIALTLCRAKKCSARIYLLEVIGEIPKSYLRWGIEYFPERVGLSLREFEIT